GQSLKPVSLPDISTAAPTVQTQLRERHAALELKVKNSATPVPELAEAYGDMGKLLMATEYLDAAEACFLNARELAPGEMRWPYYLGHVYRFRNRPVQAANYFEQALRLKPEDVAALVWLGDMQLAQSQPEAAAAPLEKALQLEPRSPGALYGLGRVALARRDYAQAVKHLEGALALSPEASRIRYPLAMAYRGLGNRQQAESNIKRRGAAELTWPDPLMEEVAGLLQNAAAYEIRGSDALDKRDWPEAVTQLRKAIELAPNNAFSRLNLGTALYLTGDSRGALEQFEAAVRLSPQFAKAHYGIGVLMEAEGRDDEAIKRFSAAVQYEAANVDARMSLGEALRRNGRLEEAMAQYEEVVKIDPGVSQARFGYAMALVRLKRYQEARERLAEAMKVYPDQPGFAHAMARLLAAAPDDRVRDGKAALSIVEQLVKIQKTPALGETMAMTLAELGRYPEAIAWQREAIAAAKQAGRSDMTASMAENLRLYERRQPCRTPWRDDDPVHFPRPGK
ncbi:MAG: tetratricopeptide repeat protein, partial [Vicinamibacterales bacterium]